MRGSFVKILAVFRIVNMILLNEIALRNKDYSKCHSIQNITFLDRHLIHNYLNN